MNNLVRGGPMSPLRAGLLAATLVLLLASVAAVVYGQGSGIEFNAVAIVVPSELHGSFQTFIVPLNVSSPALLSESNVYVVSQGTPKISYLFSRWPPLVAFIEASAYSGTYEVWYGGGNPHSELIGAPGTSLSLWLAFDDFDYPTGFWANKSVAVSGSRAYVDPGGYLALIQGYSSKTRTSGCCTAGGPS
jgi:hypothetical protein